MVMPFAGDHAAAAEALAALRSLKVQPGDELILSDNLGIVPASEYVEVVRATDERSPAHARNAGAVRARRDWILFLDADCVPAPDLLEVYFEIEVESDVGALAGEVIGATDAASMAERYGSERGFLGQRLHLSHPYMPRAVAANLLVRRAAFIQLGGFYEGLRAAEDTDFSWRLQRAGWRLEARPAARVEHRYRSSIGELRRQWRGYAAGRAWLSRRYEDFRPEPALLRAFRRRSAGPPAQRAAGNSRRREPAAYAALDALLGAEELAGLLLSNRPPGRVAQTTPQVVLVAERFPAIGDPLAEFARTPTGSRVEAASRPAAIDIETMHRLRIDYREDVGVLAGWIAVLRLAARHPVRCSRDLLHRQKHEPRLRVLSAAALRIDRERDAELRAVGGEEAQSVARRLSGLTGRQLQA